MIVNGANCYQEFRIRELSTRSVILFPSRAQIIRDIRDITLHPGINQIIIDGLTPTTDEHSIKVEGSGAAKITEVNVELLPNRDLYEEIYPSDSDEDKDGSDSEEEAVLESIKAINEKTKHLNSKLLAEKEKINSAAVRLQICDRFGASITTQDGPPTTDLETLLKTYTDERQKIFKDHSSGRQASEEIEDQIKKSTQQMAKLAKEHNRKQEKIKKEKAKSKEKNLQKLFEKTQEKHRIKSERVSFWPKNVYRVTVTIEPQPTTPASSRRNSTTTLIDDLKPNITNLASTTFHEPTNMMYGQVYLSLSYITYSASWSPRYDLSLDSVSLPLS